ncbi:MAG: GWxTD domain-containing protein [Gemmatimonadales bacterium]
MRSLATRWATVGALCGLAGCGGGRGPEGTPAAQTDQTLSQLFNLGAVYQRMGRLASTGSLQFVGNLAYLAGPADSTNLVVGLSFENRALSFQRDAGSFAARYRVEVTLARSVGDPIQVARNEIVRVPTFQETQRGDESIFFQQKFLLETGPYTLRVVVRDPTSTSVGQVEQAITVPGFQAGSITAPVMVHEVLPRRAETDSVYMILNPRGTVAHGGADTLLLYVEANGLSGPTTLPVAVTDEQDSVVYRTDVDFSGGRSVEGRVIRLAADAPPLGELTIAVGAGADAKVTKALVSFARGWVVTNYDNLLTLLRFFPYRPDLVSAMRNARPGDRPALWRRFWIETDPDPTTGENEALNTYFTRIAIANDQFRDEGGEGWRTDRGEVFITLGHPDQAYESPPGNDRRYVRWVYNQYQAIIDFEGTLGFSRLRLTTQSRAEFARARAQLLREPPRR